MFTQLTAEIIPQQLRGVAVVGTNQMPRYWPNIWILMAGHDWATSTQTVRLRYVESLYEHADLLWRPNVLDDALSALDGQALADILESWFISLRNQAIQTRSNEARWRTGLGFVTSVVTWLSASSGAKLQAMEARLHRLSTLYSQLHIRRGGRIEHVRSLPSTVVEFLYELLDPESPTNPFRRERTRWVVFISFVLMLHQGLRRGELLLLPVNAIKSARDRKAGQLRHWINIQENIYDPNDVRYSRPSIKTASSVRQIPVSEVTASLVQAYSENYRGRREHSFLLCAQGGAPLSTESLTRAFSSISAALPSGVLKELEDRTGKRSITCHDLRHTCAVLRLHQLLDKGDPMPEALQKLRTFFGWSKDSEMPNRYARAVFESRLATVWNDAFDDRTEALRHLSAGH
jgi:integrase